MVRPAGVLTGRTYAPRRVLTQESKDRVINFAGRLDGTGSYDGGQATGWEKFIRGGCFLAYDSSAGLWAPCKRTQANGLGSSSTALTVDNATHFRAGDSVIVGNNAAQAIVSINYGTNVITLTTAITWKDNDRVIVAAYATARLLLVDDEVACYDTRTLTTFNGEFSMGCCFGGPVDQDKLLGDVSAILSDPDSAYNLRHLLIDDYIMAVDAEPVPAGLFGLRKTRYLTGDYTVLAADNGTHFIATAAANITLPAKGAGLYFGFTQTADANMAILSAGSADDIIADGDAAADSVTFSTASHKIGSTVLVSIAPDLTKWLSFNVNATTATIA